MIASPIDRIGHLGVLPMGVFGDAEEAVSAARALEAGGVPVLEVTLRTPASIDALRRVRDEVPGVLVGAGTVTAKAQARAAMDAGAEFLVSPGLHRGVVEICLEHDWPIVPGALTPTELAQVLEYGLTLTKVFPVERSGGVAYLQDLAGVFSSLRFLPSGGIAEGNLAKYLDLRCVHAVSGSWIVAPGRTGPCDGDAVTAAARRAVAVVERTRAARGA